MDVQTQVIKFFAGQTQSANPKQKWDVYFANGTKATAWEYAVAAKAEQAWKSGEWITAQIEEKPNQNNPANPYKNLVGVILGAVGDAGSPATQTDPPALAGPQKPLGGFSGGMTPEDKIRVTKLSCISSAAAIFGGSGDVKTTLEAAKEIFAAIWPPSEAPIDDFGAHQLASVAPEPVAVGTQQAFSEKPSLPWAVA